MADAAARADQALVFGTAAEFEAWWAANSGLTPGALHCMGLYGEPCDCGEPGCHGWQMTRPWEDAIVEDQIRKAATS